MNKIIPKSVILISSSLLVLGSAAQAQTLLNVKIGKTANDYSGGSGPESPGAYLESSAAVLGSANSYWNEYAFVSANVNGASVVDSTGAAMSGVSLSVINSTGVGSKTTTGNPSFLMDTMPYQNAGGAFNISITGLLADTQYEFVGYAALPASSAGATWSVTTGTLGSGTTSNDGSSADITAGVGKAYSDFFVTTDGSGTLAITDASQNSVIPILQGFQLQAVAVPEPGTLAILAGGCGMLLACRRIRGKKIG